MRKARLSGSVPGPRIVEVVADKVSVPGGHARLARFCGRTLEAAGCAAWQVSILLCGDQRMAALNGRYRGLHEPTDVLSFPEEEGRKSGPVAGDVAVSLDTLRRNAAEFNVSENEEMKRLLVHGLLHLAGMDHGRGRSGKMLALQERLLRQLRSEIIFGGKRK